MWDLHRNSDVATATSRPMIGLIVAVDAENGSVRLDFPGSAIIKPMNATIPMYGASFNDVFPSWMRYIPRKGDTALVAFTRSNTPIILSYNPFAYDAETTQNREGWGSFAKANKTTPNKRDERTGEETSEKDYRWQRFDPLKEGEFDMMSSGGAYFKLGANGGILLRGGAGTAELKVTGSNDSISGYSRVFNYEAGPSSLQFGYTRRQNASTAFLEVDAIPGVPVLHPQEFNLNLKYDLGLGVTAYSSRFAMGSPVYLNNTIAPALATATVAPGEPLSKLFYTFVPGDVLGEIPFYAHEVSVAGNVGETIPLSITQKVGVAMTQIVGGAHTHTVAGVYASTIGSGAITCAGGYLVSAGATITLTSPLISLNTVPVPGVTNMLIGGSYMLAQFTAATATAAALAATIAALPPTPATGTQIQVALAPLLAWLTSLTTIYGNPALVSQTCHVGP